MIISKNCKFCRNIKFKIENGEYIFALKILSEIKLNKPKMARFLKFKFLIILKLNFNVGHFYKKTRTVWTGFKIAVRLKLLKHNNTRLYTAYKKANSKYYCFIMK